MGVTKLDTCIILDLICQNSTLDLLGLNVENSTVLNTLTVNNSSVLSSLTVNNSTLLNDVQINGTLDSVDINCNNINGANISCYSVTTSNTSNLFQETWIVATLENGWTNFGSRWGTASYKKDSLGFVCLMGLVAPGNLTLPIFHLPVGYRPICRQLFPFVSGEAFLTGYVIVDPDGSVFQYGNANVYLPLQMVRFSTA